jgi:CheY-like chemotaxis protein
MRFRILVAEDSRLNQRLATRLLHAQGHSVTIVENGRQAVEELSNGVYDLVLMDVDMPEMDGLAATRTIRTDEVYRGRRVPIVAVTTNDDLDACFEAGMDAYLPKPLQSHRLNQVLEAILGRTAA